MLKYLIITGGNRGIGAKTISYFIQDGWEIINISRSPSSVLGVHNVILDLSKPLDQENTKEWLANLIKKASNVCLVHNAAFYKRDSIHSLSLDDLLITLQTNVISAIALNKILIPMMPSGSCIIYIGSTLAEKAVPGSASYTISKHAIIGLMKATCQDLIDQQIRSCCVSPGLVNTSLLKETMSNETIEYLLQNKVIGKRLIEPEEIARIIHFCAVNTSINGTTINANLGHFAE